MRKPPRRKDAPIINQRLLYRVAFSASIIVVETLFIYTYALSDDKMSRREQTMARSFTISSVHWLLQKLTSPAPQTFTCFVFLDLVSAIQNRGLGCGITQNKMLVSTVSVSFIVQLSLIYVPLMQSIFQTAALDSGDLLLLLILAGISFTLHEFRRGYERKLNAVLTSSTTMEEMA